MEMTTAWGAPADDLQHAAAGLRALASRSDVDLRSVEEVDPADLAAAVAAAHLLCLALRVETLSELAHPRHRAAAALARVLLRSAGHGSTDRPVAAHGAGLPDLRLAGDADDVAVWVRRHLPADADRALAAAAGDLAGTSCRPAEAAAQALAAHVTDPVWFLGAELA